MRKIQRGGGGRTPFYKPKTDIFFEERCRNTENYISLRRGRGRGTFEKGEKKKGLSSRRKPPLLTEKKHSYGFFFRQGKKNTKKRPTPTRTHTKGADHSHLTVRERGE